MGSVDDVPAVGRLLNPAAVTPGQPFQIREEEVLRAGVRVQRVVFLARGFDGTTHLWVARRKLPGAGEAQSGLRYDTAIFTGQQ
jgi:hypothetical protein